MIEGQAVTASDRLPWLADDPVAKTDRRAAAVWTWSVPVLAAIAAASFWFGQQTAPSDDEAERNPHRAPVTVIPLPEPSEAAVERSTAQARAEPTVRRGRVVARTAPRAPSPRSHPVAKTVPGTPETTALAYWPVRAPAAAAGRMVRIGTFATRGEAKKGWSAVTRIYPGMRQIPALVVPLRSARDGRTYFRLQMGTTSQAHSEVLCQRMRIIGQSCIVVGVNGKAG